MCLAFMALDKLVIVLVNSRCRSRAFETQRLLADAKQHAYYLTSKSSYRLHQYHTRYREISEYLQGGSVMQLNELIAASRKQCRAR